MIEDQEFLKHIRSLTSFVKPKRKPVEGKYIHIKSRINTGRMEHLPGITNEYLSIQKQQRNAQTLIADRQNSYDKRITFCKDHQLTLKDKKLVLDDKMKRSDIYFKTQNRRRRFALESYEMEIEEYLFSCIEHDKLMMEIRNLEKKLEMLRKKVKKLRKCETFLSDAFNILEKTNYMTTSKEDDDDENHLSMLTIRHFMNELVELKIMILKNEYEAKIRYEQLKNENENFLIKMDMSSNQHYSTVNHLSYGMFSKLRPDILKRHLPIGLKLLHINSLTFSAHRFDIKNVMLCMEMVEQFILDRRDVSVIVDDD
ncbi:hypothetical protein SNEBB_002509 [Seison nebaliae]|nr:hypothetical protein SNEBB_002509 [Seison nebaliae]